MAKDYFKLKLNLVIVLQSARWPKVSDLDTTWWEVKAIFEIHAKSGPTAHGLMIVLAV